MSLRRDPLRAENGNAGRDGPAGVQREQCDEQDRMVPAADSDAVGRQDQDQHTSAVGQGASPVSRAGSGPSGGPSAIEAYHAELAERFAARRCRHCGAPAVAVIVGRDAVREVGILLQRARSDRNLCLLHAGLLDNRRAA